MPPHEWNLWLLFFLIAVPLASIAGPFAWAATWMLAGLALMATHPAVALAIAAAWVVFRSPLRWIGDGLLLGLGARLSGVFNSPERAEKRRERFVTQRTKSRRRTHNAPRSRGRSPATYMPWEQSGDDMPGDL
jgi:hypothetical protein